MTPARIYDSGRYIKYAIATLGDRIGMIDVKDVIVDNSRNVCHISEAKMGTGLLDHETLIRASSQLEPWKTFTFEHLRSMDSLKLAFNHIQGIANRIGHKWTDPACTRENWESGQC